MNRRRNISGKEELEARFSWEMKAILGNGLWNNQDDFVIVNEIK